MRASILSINFMSRLLLLPFLLLLTLPTVAQNTYLTVGTDDYWMLDRLETRSGRLCDTLCLSAKMESRKNAVQFLGMLLDGQQQPDSNNHRTRFSRVDLNNMRQMISQSGEWTDDENGAILSKHKWSNVFYKTQYNLAYIKTKDFFLVINPVINLVGGSETNSPAFKDKLAAPYYKSNDAEFRGWVGKKIGFYINFTDNTERLPAYVYNYAVKGPLANNPRSLVPGGGYYNPGPPKRTTATGYFLASGYIDFAAVKNKVNVTFGSGKNFIGDGTSSLFLTDASNNMPFLKVRARLWKINYEVMYMQLTQQFKKGPDDYYSKKFATMHYITYNPARWLNLNFFESVVFSRPNSYEISYLNPVALTLANNAFNGAADKALLGFGAKIIFARHFQLYGQLMLNEFRTKELLSNKGWYGNKWGIQAGAKYFDAFGINNLDLQGELMAVRPYSYTAQDTIANYTHYNQTLADPLGAGFVKFTGILRCQPLRNVVVSIKTMYYVQGNDTGRLNYGNDVFKAYTTAPNGSATYGVKMINGPRSTCSLVNFNISWQARRNLFLDLGSISRRYSNAGDTYPAYATTGIAYGPLNTNYVYFGFRLNSVRRDYSFL